MAKQPDEALQQRWLSWVLLPGVSDPRESCLQELSEYTGRPRDEVLALWFVGHDDTPLAISAEFLAAHPIHHDRVGSLRIVVLTDPSGANRVFDAKDVVIAQWDGDATVTDASGRKWTVSESRLTASDGRTLARLPAHRAFWFGWYAAFPGTRLVK